LALPCGEKSAKHAALLLEFTSHKELPMLVLSRKKNESIVIGSGPNAVKLVVVEIRGDKVRLGFEAPKEVFIHRQEVHEAIEQAKNDSEQI